MNRVLHTFSLWYEKHKGSVSIALFLIALLLAAAILGGKGMPFAQGTFTEVEELRSGEFQSFQDYSTYFRKLAEQKGAPYAFEVLKRAPFPPGIDLHLLAHVVGDMLYKQQGIQGIHVCTQDFRNACSHSVVIGILNEHGEGALPEIAKTCREAPGGRGAYTMCFHGLGHGVLAYNGYDYEQAIAMCEKTGTDEYQQREYIECVGGMTMEMIAGVHDRAAWEEQKARFFKDEDPLYPCSASFMPEEVRPICYVYLTPHLFEAAGMDLGVPDPASFEKAFASCHTLPSNDSIGRDACFGGFGKEFIVIAQGRDIRDVGTMQAPQLQHIRTWCAKAGNPAGEQSCNSSALASLFWGGENNPDASFLFCEIAEGTPRERCYQELAGHIAFYLSGNSEGKKLCGRLPETYRAMCSGSVRP